MTAVHSTTVIFFYIQLIVCVTSQACPSGYFGTSCKYKCRCKLDMCDVNGSCLRGNTCLPRWFGPACQYADIAAYGQPAGNYLTDGDDSTCGDYTGGTGNVTLNLNDSYPFTWLRVHVSSTEAVSNLQVIFNNTVSCNNPRNATVDGQTWDINCTMDAFVKSVTLTGPAASFLCSFYISGGRDIAINENAQQTSTYQSYTANLSVDGNVNPAFNAGHCSATTGSMSTLQSWNVTFSQPRLVNRYAIYNRGDSADYRLQGFSLESFDGSTRVFNYTNSQGTLPVYTVKHRHLHMSLVRITNGYQDNVLQMCEMEIYGESICGDGQYGRECEHTCNCNGEQLCFVSTGGCPSGCASGYQGENCSIPCSPGKYGLGCLTNCSEFCAKDTNDATGVRSCDHFNGTCDLGCEDGYRGSHCNLTCQREQYGRECNNTCSQQCANPTAEETSCDYVNGTCRFGCQAGYKEPLCLKACDPGKYGPGCGYNCSSICVASNTTGQSPCHHVTGVCMFGCRGGYDPTICDPVSDSGSAGDSDKAEVIGIIVGCVLGVIVLAVIIAAVIFILRRQKRGKPNTNNSQLAVAGNSLPDDDVRRDRQSPPGKAGGKGQKVDNSGTPGIYYNSFAGSQVPTVVRVDELADLMTSKDKDFFKSQFSAIPVNETATMNVGLSSENKHKNRYKNVCAYDHSRVHLKPNAAKKHGDYINASYIEGYQPDEKFIASQGPTKIILEDFVRMLWEQQVEKVVMLTNVVEEGKQKCERYWPEDGEMKVGEITVCLTTTEVFADYTIHRLQLKKDGSPSQELIHFHFTSWPDKDIPNTPWGLVDFEQRVASYPTNKPIVVHCSAGVGRTGTFIALRNVMREAEETGHMDFFKTVQKLRQDRINMVQTADQYIFLHNAALVAILCIGTTVTSKDMEKRVAVLGTKLPSGQTQMEAEFRSVCSACDDKNEEKLSEDNPSNVYENSQNIVNTQKNRVESILPKELYRAKLRCENDDMADYINAVLVPSFSKQNQQILTQLPLPSTVTDFWRLVTQYKVTVIVAFQADLKSTDPTIADYLPLGESKTSNNLPMFSISTKSTKSATFWRKQEVSITIDTNRMQKFSVVTNEHHLTHLACTTTDLDKGTLLAITQQIRSLRPAGSGRTLYMCRNGAEYSGLVCVLSLLLDRMDNDYHLTVPLVVGAIKAIRPQVIPTLDQYKLLYEALQLYSESFNEYTNFGGSSSSIH